MQSRAYCLKLPEDWKKALSLSRPNLEHPSATGWTGGFNRWSPIFHGDFFEVAAHILLFAALNAVKNSHKYFSPPFFRKFSFQLGR